MVFQVLTECNKVCGNCRHSPSWLPSPLRLLGKQNAGDAQRSPATISSLGFRFLFFFLFISSSSVVSPSFCKCKQNAIWVSCIVRHLVFVYYWQFRQNSRNAKRDILIFASADWNAKVENRSQQMYSIYGLFRNVKVRIYLFVRCYSPFRLCFNANF